MDKINTWIKKSKLLVPMLSPVNCNPITKKTFLLAHYATTLMELLMFFNLSQLKFTSSVLEPTLLGVNSILALASCLGPTSPILQESWAQ